MSEYLAGLLVGAIGVGAVGLLAGIILIAHHKIQSREMPSPDTAEDPKATIDDYILPAPPEPVKWQVAITDLAMDGNGIGDPQRYEGMVTFPDVEGDARMAYLYGADREEVIEKAMLFKRATEQVYREQKDPNLNSTTVDL